MTMMEKKNKDYEERGNSVIELLKKQHSPTTLTPQHEKFVFCNEEYCVERFLKANHHSVKRATKQLTNCLSWRETFGIENLRADEFSGELAEGVAYVAGHDHQSRPVMIFRIKQEYQKHGTQKKLTRLLVFTLEVAIQTMPKNVHQFVLLFDASFFRSATSFMNMLLPTLKIIADYYPLRLFKAFVIDPPSLFIYLWKGVRPFVELSPSTIVIRSLDDSEETPLQFSNITTSSSSRCLDHPSTPMASENKLGSCSSSRFSFTVSRHSDTLKPWYLSLTDASESKSDSSPVINSRSQSFSSPMLRKGVFPTTPTLNLHSRTAKRSFIQSPASFFRKDCRPSQAADQKLHESIVPFLRFYRQPYDEMIYRSKMRPPLGGLVPIVTPRIRRRRHIYSMSQRF